MTYRLSLAVDPNICLEIEEANFEDLLDLFEKMKGDRQWLINAAKASVARSLHGEAVGNVVRAMDGDVIADDSPDDAPPQGNGRRAPAASGRGGANGGRTARRSDEGPADPWASGGDAQPDSEPTDGDPWGEDNPPAPRGRQRSTQGRSGGNSGGRPHVEKDRFDREWTTGLPDAPDCNCGEPAARCKAKSQAGKWYTTWKCAKGAPGGDWQSKCEFSEFPN